MNETKPSVLIAKRLLLALNGIIDSENYEFDKKQILDDSNNLANAIQTMLTKIDTAAVSFKLLKRLHLIPEQLKNSILAIGDSTRDLEKVKSMVSNLLLDLESLEQVKIYGAQDESAVKSLAPVTVVKKKFSLPKSNTESTLYPSHVFQYAEKRATKLNETEVLKDYDSCKLFNTVALPDSIVKEATNSNPIKFLEGLSESKNLIRIESKLDEVLKSINVISQSSLNRNSTCKLHSEAKSQLKKLSKLRTAVYSTRKMTERILSEALGCLEDGRTKLRSFKAGKISCIEQKSNLGPELEEFSFFLETVKKDLVKGSRPGLLFQEHIQKRLEELSETYQAYRERTIRTKSEKKKEWENSLQSILSQQQRVTESCAELEFLSKGLESAKELASSILPVIEFQQSKPLEIKYPEINVLESDMVQEGMQNVLAELAFVKRKSDNIEQLVTKFKKVSVSQSNPFQSELEAFIANGSLKDRGGVAAIERRREKQLEEFIYSLSL